MRVAQQVLHRSARAISLSEFADAVRETCKPRFPEARGVIHRQVALAISGGVDSMALAYLCSQIRRFDPDIKITDNPCSGFRAFVVDHMLRGGSTAEAKNVAAALNDLHVPCDILQINWKKELGDSVEIGDVTNIESVARRARYRKLGKALAFRRMATLLLAHHEDDQYETVLMRLMSGHRNRALRGMRKAAGIPECEGLLGAYDSGWVDDQNRQYPFYSTRLTKRQRKYLKYDLRSSINQCVDEDLDENTNIGDECGIGGRLLNFDASTELGTIPIEDGGVNIYRPLLEFSKDRLIATCLENNVPWFEDATNQDPTLTTRNSIRHLHRSCDLPRALQKPSIIALSKSWQRRAETQDAEAERLLQRTILHDFEPHVGSLVVQLPDIPAVTSRRYTRTEERYRRRVSRMRLITALAIQRIIALVTPELQAPTVANLQNVVSWLFPGLADTSDGQTATPPKAFNIAGLHFMPIDSTPRPTAALSQSHPRTWYISRQPYTTTSPLPTWRVSYWSAIKPSARTTHHVRWKWSAWMPWQFWDNRFWVRLTHRLPYRVIVMPFLSDHTKDFRASLSSKDRKRLAILLKKFAPGKVRYTLPAIYSEEHLDLKNVVPRVGYPVPEDDYIPGELLKREGNSPPLAPIDPSKMRLLALPTFNIQLPGLESWLLHEVRYKRADRQTLRAMTSHRNRSFASRNAGRRENAKTVTVGRKAMTRRSRQTADEQHCSTSVDQ
ncbi:hypothetical protein BKA67DRAFT_532079 [Truncatella angustata]|uniref:tRNA(Ile)-lysidine synthetase n=1 Tax=Truncatella angustata TaxID=152316 RepID=A0A9P8UQY1_9PEZI|nr:uncharacterized protein BKA67DRAFT_532079 [Truncatella angustata]KAH6656832.1 hypothetical protein BKA67DRAFT_532079 [Truncatella angustata]